MMHKIFPKLATGSLHALVVHQGAFESKTATRLIDSSRLFGRVRAAQFENSKTPVHDVSDVDLVIASLDSTVAELAFVSRPEARHVPCLFISHSGPHDRALLLRSGACDVVEPSVHLAEWTYRVRAHVARHRNARACAHRVVELERESRTDKLTGLPNRRLLDEVLDREFQRARRHGATVTAVMADLDGFKSINDTHGHGVGDAALCKLATILNVQLRGTDIAGRYGGDEFLAVLSDTPRQGAEVFANRWRRGVNNVSVEGADGHSIRLSMSVGIAELDGRMTTPQALVEAADVELYRAKGLPRPTERPPGSEG